MSSHVQGDKAVAVPEKDVKVARDSSSQDDVEKQGLSHIPELQRRLKSRHLQMIAIGNAFTLFIILSMVLLILSKVVLLELVSSLVAELHFPSLVPLEP